MWHERVIALNNVLFYIAGNSRALQYASDFLKGWGFSFSEDPCGSVTHLLLPVPSFDPSGSIRGGGSLPEVLAQLPETVTIVGGNLNHPALEGHPTIDLLQDPYYLASNAAITAHCALKLLLQRLPVCLENASVLVIGWGRIGKCLAALLRSLGARVTVSARKCNDRAMLEALGYDTDLVPPAPEEYRAIFNTAPEQILSCDQAQAFPESCIKIDLASVQGIAGEDVLIARGLPGKDAPESSGKLIASTITRLIYNKE